MTIVQQFLANEYVAGCDSTTTFKCNAGNEGVDYWV